MTQPRNRWKKNNAIMNSLMPTGIGECHWCKCRIFRAFGSEQNPNTATVDHIYSVGDIRRNLVSDRDNTVLACHKCNGKRNAQEIKERLDFYLSLKFMREMYLKRFVKKMKK